MPGNPAFVADGLAISAPKADACDDPKRVLFENGRPFGCQTTPGAPVERDVSLEHRVQLELDANLVRRIAFNSNWTRFWSPKTPPIGIGRDFGRENGVQLGGPPAERERFRRAKMAETREFRGFRCGARASRPAQIVPTWHFLAENREFREFRGFVRVRARMTSVPAAVPTTHVRECTTNSLNSLEHDFRQVSSPNNARLALAVAHIQCRCYTYPVEFEWDAAKAVANEHKHSVGFMEASTCFWDPHQVAFYDPDHSDEEDREIILAHSAQGRLLMVVYTLRGERIRMISARQATRKEARDYARGV